MNVVVYFLCRRKACLPGPCRPIISGPDFISAACDLMIIRLPLQYRNLRLRFFLSGLLYDFIDILKALGKGSEITLVAQWVKLPDPDKPYIPPVTGVE